MKVEGKKYIQKKGENNLNRVINKWMDDWMDGWFNGRCMDGWMECRKTLKLWIIFYMPKTIIKVDGDGWMDGVSKNIKIVDYILYAKNNYEGGWRWMDGWMDGVLKNIKMGDYILYAKKNYEGEKRKYVSKRRWK